MQKPPAFSAIHINGKRERDLARSRKTAKIPERKIKDYKAEILELKKDKNNAIEYARISFTVSKGTYIRSLARDIAQKCGSAGHLTGLYRKKVGNFYIKDAAGFYDLEEFNIENCIKKAEEWKNEEVCKDKNNPDFKADCEKNLELKAAREKLHAEILEKKLDFSKECAKLCGFDVINLVSKNAEAAFKNGKPLYSALFDKKLQEIQNQKSAAVFTQDGNFCGLIKKDEQGKISYSFVLN